MRTLVHVKPLVVLDINGVLCHRRRKKEKGNYRASIGTVANTKIIPRPDLEEFLCFLHGHFALAVWTSAKPRNARALVDVLFPPHVKRSLLFVWGQNECKVHVPKGMRPSYENITYIKSLHKVWDTYPLWNQYNTLIIDDSPDKCPPAYSYNSLHPLPILGIHPQSPLHPDPDFLNIQHQRHFFAQLAAFWDTFEYNTLHDLHYTSTRFIQFMTQHAVAHMGWRGTSIQHTS